MRSLLTSASLCALLLAGCSGSKHTGATGASNTGGARTTTVVHSGTGFRLVDDTPTVVSAGPAVALPPRITKAAEQLVTSYAATGMVAPLTSGRLGHGFSDLFTADALSGLAHDGNDRRTVTDLGVARGAGPVRVRASMHLTGLAGANGTVVMVTARINAAIRRGKLAVDRAGELLLARGPGGHWRIVGYDLRVRRATSGTATTTTTAKKKATP